MEKIRNQSENKIISDIRTLIEQTRQQVAVTVNSAMTLVYWHIGERINREVLGGERAAYGKQIVETISRQLTKEYGGNQFSLRNLRRMMQIYIDLLFFNRRLRCMVAIDLKLIDFKAAYKGQMELYLRWLEKYEMMEGENKPIGLILCTGKNEEHIELMHLHESNIRVAEYLTKLPDTKLLEQKLQQAVEIAKEKPARA